jgi:hypothetical protein
MKKKIRQQRKNKKCNWLANIKTPTTQWEATWFETLMAHGLRFSLITASPFKPRPGHVLKRHTTASL